MHAGVATLIDEMRADPVLASHADACAAALEAIDIEGDGCTDAIACTNAINWIASQPRSLNEKLEALHKLFSLKGHNAINMRKLTGW
jgi:hypothetical protein